VAAMVAIGWIAIIAEGVLFVYEWHKFRTHLSAGVKFADLPSRALAAFRAEKPDEPLQVPLPGQSSTSLQSLATPGPSALEDGASQRPSALGEQLLSEVDALLSHADQCRDKAFKELQIRPLVTPSFGPAELSDSD